MTAINFEKDRIFGVMDASKANTEGLELRYEVEHGQEGDPCYLRQRVYRDADGNYYMAAKGGADATLGFETRYSLSGREVLIPMRPEAPTIWAESNLCGEEYGRASEEFKIPASFMHKDIWLYQQGITAGQQGYVYERLWKTDGGSYILFSTEYGYPCPGYNAPVLGLNGDGTCRDDLYIYYITPETAQRWAEARGMGLMADRETFGGCAA